MVSFLIENDSKQLSLYAENQFKTEICSDISDLETSIKPMHLLTSSTVSMMSSYSHR